MRGGGGTLAGGRARVGAAVQRRRVYAERLGGDFSCGLGSGGVVARCGGMRGWRTMLGTGLRRRGGLGTGEPEVAARAIRVKKNVVGLQLNEVPKRNR